MHLTGRVRVDRHFDHFGAPHRAWASRLWLPWSFGRWSWAAEAAFFSFGNALRIGLASSAPQLLDVVPQGVLLALPYALTLLVLRLQRRAASAAPAALGTPYDPELR